MSLFECIGEAFCLLIGGVAAAFLLWCLWSLTMHMYDTRMERRTRARNGFRINPMFQRDWKNQ